MAILAAKTCGLKVNSIFKKGLADSYLMGLVFADGHLQSIIFSIRSLKISPKFEYFGLDCW